MEDWNVEYTCMCVQFYCLQSAGATATRAIKVQSYYLYRNDLARFKVNFHSALQLCYSFLPRVHSYIHRLNGEETTEVKKD